MVANSRRRPLARTPGSHALGAWLPWIVRAISVVVVALAWELVGRTQNSALFAPISRVVGKLAELLGNRDYIASFVESLGAFVIGLTLALALGVLLGALMGRYEKVGLPGIVYISIFLAVPMSTVIPVVVVTAGVGLAARAVVVFLFAFFEIAWNAYLGVRFPDRSQVEMATSYGASERQMFTRVLLPGALPAIMAGIRLGTGRAFIGMVAAELLLASVGIGLLVRRYQSRFQAPELLATVLLLLLIAALVIALLKYVEKRLLKRFAPA